MSVVAVDRNAAGVVAALEDARQSLASAVEMTGAAGVAVIKAQILMAETYSRELQLSKEIREQAQEMVRRAEWSLEQAIKRDRDAGLIKGLVSGGGMPTPGVRGSRRSEADQDDRPSARDYFSNGEERSQIYQIGQATAEELEAAIDAAKAEGNLSRANVVRKVKQQDGAATRQQRADMIATLASEGYSVRQMPDKVGIGEQAIRNILRDYDIDVPADRTMRKTKRHDSTRIAAQTVTALEGLVMGVELIDYDDLDDSQASQWVDSLNHSLLVLNRFRKQIGKATQ